MESRLAFGYMSSVGCELSRDSVANWGDKDVAAWLGVLVGMCAVQRLF